VACDGHTYERAFIKKWFTMSRQSPLTKRDLADLTLRPNWAVRKMLESLGFPVAHVEANAAERDTNNDLVAELYAANEELYDTNAGLAERVDELTDELDTAYETLKQSRETHKRSFDSMCDNVKYWQNEAHTARAQAARYEPTNRPTVPLFGSILNQPCFPSAWSATS